MRLLLYNPNTDASLTARLSLAMARSLAPGDELKTSTSNKGASFIGSAETIAVAKGALLRDLPARAEGCDAIVLGCFGDLGIATLRRRLGLPIVSLSDAAFAIVPLSAKRIGIVTTSPFWVQRLAGEARRKGAQRWIVGMRPVSAVGLKPATLLAKCRSEIAIFAQEERCEAIILGGAALAWLGPELNAGSPLPILDPLSAAVGLCRACCAAFSA